MIICRFGVPSYITVNNGKQLDCTKFRNFCSELGIKLTFASVNHPESNVAVERANGLIFSAVSKTLFNFPKGNRPRNWSLPSGVTTSRALGQPSSPLFAYCRAKSNHARGAQARVFSYPNCSNHSNTVICGARSGRKHQVTCSDKPRQIS